jgi:hypothetical protein
METQKDASAYLEANRKLMDEVREILRREQNLSLELSNKLLEDATENGGTRMGDTSTMNAMFDSAIASIRELGEAWMSAQMRSLDAMRRHAANGQGHGRQRRRPTD